MTNPPPLQPLHLSVQSLGGSGGSGDSSGRTKDTGIPFQRHGKHTG
jgi:hypothetical protein